ncbi:hypothetical protein [Pseudonocardia spinosispora]|uniref:DODA-type extradiol aromatic ring-opening family dioxygenase n=1 Tax=Pseudonocardia spinosispora TaxID=103441 RepID=UPI0004000C03|nr:hypothetical protein [Pseudonocardia spinosispora]
MAKVVFGLGASHSPMLSTPLEQWPSFIEKDRDLPKFLGEKLLGTDGELYTFDELALRADPGIRERLTDEYFATAYEACQTAIRKAGEALTAAAPDVVIAIGDDQQELFHDTNMPSFAVYRGDHMMNVPPDIDHVPPNLRHGLWGWYDEKPTRYPADAGLGEHLITSLGQQGFDPSTVLLESDDVSMSHAYTYIHRRIMREDVRPLVPVFVNCFYAPNQPSTKRCLEFGRAIRSAIDSWDSDKTVGIVASGGLSHFVVDEKLDRQVLDSMKTGDFSAVLDIPEKHLQSGNSEVKNWFVLGAALADLSFDEIDYIPCYRSAAGTGCGMAFGTWS